MRRLLLMLSLTLAVPAAVAQSAQPEWRQAAEHQVLLRPNAFEPEEIRLTAGIPARLVFFNNSRTALSLTAEFGRKHLDGHLAAEQSVDSDVHVAHSAPIFERIS